METCFLWECHFFVSMPWAYFSRLSNEILTVCSLYVMLSNNIKNSFSPKIEIQGFVTPPTIY